MDMQNLKFVDQKQNVQVPDLEIGNAEMCKSRDLLTKNQSPQIANRASVQRKCRNRNLLTKKTVSLYRRVGEGTTRAEKVRFYEFAHENRVCPEVKGPIGKNPAQKTA